MGANMVMPNTRSVGEEPALPMQYGMVGDSAQMRALFRNIARASATDAPVLITGESGTGKELAARAIHDHCPRAAKPFVAVNCAALPDGSIHAELFGHEKGAFIGAHDGRPGCIEAAAGGTLFLDEIGELPLDAQAAMLGFLQDKRNQPVGAANEPHTDVRVIASTNVDVERAVSEGQFRGDLFYRLDVLRLHVPSLRERAGDIEHLARYFVAKYSREISNRRKVLGEAALGLLHSYAWPGNARELMNRVRRAVMLTVGWEISPTDLGIERRSVSRDFASLEDARMKAEKAAVQASLRQTGQNISRAAEQLCISRMTLYRLMEKHGIEKNAGEPRRRGPTPSS